jgi:pyruvate/2-oxoglutarate dehydrogenase complex dihydrolipoamide dehydrogenase (E3) component
VKLITLLGSDHVRKIVVLGGGPAGVEAALTAASYSQDVTIVTKGPVASWKLASSRIWLAATAPVLPFQNQAEISIPNIVRYANQVEHRWQSSYEKLLCERGVSILYGQAQFKDACTLLVTNDLTGKTEIITADKIIIATGSRPMFPEGIQPNGKNIYSFNTLNLMQSLPKSILVVGDGPIGSEMVNVFSRLHVETTWIVANNEPRSWTDKDINQFLINEYINRGVKIIAGHPVIKIVDQTNFVEAHRSDGSVITAETSFVTLGFKSNADLLQVEQAGLYLNQHDSVSCNEFGQTDIDSIYIVGDAQMTFAGVYSMAKARVAALHAADQQPAPVDMQCIPLTFNEAPQVAIVGKINSDDPNVYSKKIPFDSRNFRAHLNQQHNGFIKIFWSKENIIVGASAVGTQASEVVTILALAIKMKAKLSDLRTFWGAHPSISEVPFLNL